ncbi:BQ5605_C006g04063 [Microbotryum silenes-dioicae]|uniref:ATP-dependent DNA helicase n=1 Tax=Microbotryum silenes-dioicae TaxID=796604 RepID=A0A2X0MA16_9BASI|nr:BQ5605_C006g04063 [Microbotryum silenes-dioicae]
MQTVLRVYHVNVKERFSIFLPPALHTLPIAPHPIATSSLRHPKRSSWKLCNEYGTCFLKKLCSMQHRSRGKSSTARFGGVTVAMAGDPKRCLPVTLNGLVRWSDRRVGRKSEAMPSRYSTARFGGVTIALAAMPSRYSTARWSGVTVVLAGDPKQCLPVVLKSSPIQIVDACIMNADFWVEVEVLLDFVRLRIRMDNSKNTNSCNESRKKNRSVNCGSPSRGRSSTARFGGVTVVLTVEARARAFRSGPTQFFAEPCLYRINIDVCEVARGARRRT